MSAKLKTVAKRTCEATQNREPLGSICGRYTSNYTRHPLNEIQVTESTELVKYAHPGNRG
jgi:hypothetical protein